MSSQYNTEPPPTASVTLNTTVGPLHIALFAKQTPLASKNFIQHCLDGYYTGTVFHRIVPGFVIQGGDPTGTGSGGSSIYEDAEFEYDPEARDPNEKVVFGDEIHSRLRFNRRGLVGMAKGEDGTYGSQFFITLGNTERQMNGQCTMFGRIEGDSIYNMVKIAEAELVEGTERPVYAVKVIGCEVGEMGQFAGKLKKRDKIAKVMESKDEKVTVKKKKKAKGGKTLLSFGAEEAEDDGEDLATLKAKKPKFNTNLVSAGDGSLDIQPKTASSTENQSKKRRHSPSPPPKKPASNRRTRPRSPDPYMQVPPKDPEEPERSPSETPPPAARPSILERTEAEIASLKASMRRNVTTQEDTGRKKSALEAMIPETSIRGRKRPPPGSAAANGKGTDSEALKLFNAFKAKLEGSDSQYKRNTKTKESNNEDSRENTKVTSDEVEDEEAQLCDLHFIANCQSCQKWSENPEGGNEGSRDQQNEDSTDWMTHRLQFGKDLLGKDLNWKKEHRDDADSLMVIDPREKEKEYVHRGGKSRKTGRDRERENKRERASEREWDRK